MTHQELRELYERCSTGNCTREEQKLFEEYADDFDLSDIPWLPEFGDKELIEKRLRKDFKRRSYKLKKNRVKIILSIAALFLIIMGTVIYYSSLLTTRKHTPPLLAANSNRYQHVSPRALLTVSDGRKIRLDGVITGNLFTENNILVGKDNAARISYRKDGAKRSGGARKFNILETPRGGKYELVLADGTKVWLNAASSLKYPVDFDGNERVVELSGEAYFEVAHHKGQTFKVLSNSQAVEVLGTHFNINAYLDEDAIKTTLLEGSVRVSGKENSLIIKPDEQAIFRNKQLSKVSIDASEAIAWKKGFIQFKNADLKSIMRKIARWYDIKVIYEGHITDDKYSGEISGNADITEVVKILKINDINLKIVGKNIVIAP